MTTPGLSLVSGGSFIPATLVDQFGCLQSWSSNLDSYLQIPREFLAIGEYLDRSNAPKSGCIQSIHIEHYDPGVTQELAWGLLRYKFGLGTLPPPRYWTRRQGSVVYTPGAYVVDIRFEPADGESVNALQSQQRLLQRQPEYLQYGCGACDALMAIALQGYEFPNLLHDADISRTVIAGLDMASAASASQLAPLLEWNTHGERKNLEGFWAPLPLVRCLVPVVMGRRSLEELKQVEKPRQPQQLKPVGR